MTRRPAFTRRAFRGARKGPRPSALLSRWRRDAGVLLVGDLLHPLDNLAIEVFLDGEVGHRGRRRRAMPVSLARRDPDHVSWPDFLDRSALDLYPPDAGRHDQ